MYYTFFTIYILVGFFITLPVIYWAMKNGQFKDQQRARFLPLEDEPETEQNILTKISSFEFYALYGLVSIGLALSAAVLIWSLWVG